MAVTANHAGVLRPGHNAETDSAVAIADNLLRHHDILLLPTMKPASPFIHKTKSAEVTSALQHPRGGRRRFRAAIEIIQG